MKNYFIITSIIISLKCSGQINQIQSKLSDAKSVYISGFFGDIYGYLNWNDDVELELIKNGFSPESIQIIKTNVDVNNHPQHLSSNALFMANKHHLNNFNCKEVVSFKSYEPESQKTLKYQLIWVPLTDNLTAPDGIRPTTENGIFYMMHRFSMKNKKDPKENEPIVTKHQLDSMETAKKMELAKKQQLEAEYQEQLDNTYTLTYLLKKTDNGLGSVRIFYSAAFIEVYDETKKATESAILKRAEQEFYNNISLNGFVVDLKYLEKTTGEKANVKVRTKVELTDFKTYRCTLQ